MIVTFHMTHIGKHMENTNHLQPWFSCGDSLVFVRPRYHQSLVCTQSQDQPSIPRRQTQLETRFVKGKVALKFVGG